MEITLKLSVAEVNTLLQSLGQMPYVSVVELIEKVKTQAGPQVNQQKQEG